MVAGFGGPVAFRLLTGGVESQPLSLKRQSPCEMNGQVPATNSGQPKSRRDWARLAHIHDLQTLFTTFNHELDMLSFLQIIEVEPLKIAAVEKDLLSKATDEAKPALADEPLNCSLHFATLIVEERGSGIVRIVGIV